MKYILRKIFLLHHVYIVLMIHLKWGFNMQKRYTWFNLLPTVCTIVMLLNPNCTMVRTGLRIRMNVDESLKQCRHDVIKIFF
jgi:hypothetical protein